MYIPPLRRPHILFGTLIGIATLLLFHNVYRHRLSLSMKWSIYNSNNQYNLELDPYVASRVQRWREHCTATPNQFEAEYGRTNLRLSRGYEGSHHRTQQLLYKALRGESLTVSAIGGSVTKGHGVEKNEIWFHRFSEWFNEFVGHDVDVKEVNGAAPATGSDYFSFCFPLHIPNDADLVLVELAVNDEGIPEHVENMENLLRGLLDMPNQPAVMLVEVLAFSNGGMGGGGGRMHLPVAQYYDVPVISHRYPLVNHFARYPALVWEYFTRDWWGNPDTRHINGRGHRDLSSLVSSFVQDVACQMVADDNLMVPPPANEPMTPIPIVAHLNEISEDPVKETYLQDEVLSEIQSTWPQQSRTTRKTPKEGELVGESIPGVWTTPIEYGLMPRLRVLEGWDPNLSHTVPPFHPTCLSIRSTIPQFNLTPSTNDGWVYWVHDEHLDKPYLLGKKPGDIVTFDLETSLGVVKMYSLRSKTFGLGTVECWVDDERDRAVKVVGWWDNGDVNIGRFATIRTDLHPGRHTVSCQVLEETSDPNGGHEFRMISIMSV